MHDLREVPVLNLQVVFHLPQELDGEFDNNVIRRGPIKAQRREFPRGQRTADAGVAFQMWLNAMMAAQARRGGFGR